MNEISLEDLMYSVENEAQESQKKEKTDNTPPKEAVSNKTKPTDAHVTGNKDQKKDVVDKVKELAGKADNIHKRIRLWSRQRKNLSFYKKYLDRVQHLWEKNAEEAKVNENEMYGDPVKILVGPAQKYIRSLVKNINTLYTEVLNMSRALEGKVSAEQAISVVKSYCNDVKWDRLGMGELVSGKTKDGNTMPWKEKLLKATKYKIANIMYSNRETKIYGFTIKNMVLKKYPTPNHLIVTMFVVADEIPREWSVSDIFSGPDSFDIIADTQKKDIFNVVNMTRAVLEKSVDNKVMNEIAEYKKRAIQNFKNAELENKNDNAKIIDSIWDGINRSCKELLSMKSYLIECINVYFDMILRIDNLAVNAIKEMLQVEEKYRDHRYDKHSKLAKYGHKKGSNNYVDEVDFRHISHKRGNNLDKVDRYRQINQTAKDLNKKMK